MASSEPNALSLGTRAPDFSLPDTRNNQPVSLSEFAGQPVLIVFMCNHCPYVVHLVDSLVSLAASMAGQGTATVAISANDSSRYPQDGPLKMAELAELKNFSFPYCFDEDQSVARAYGAVCTPEFYLFDAAHHLFYHGQFDETRPGQGVAHGASVHAAFTSMLAGQSAPTETKPSVGCSIKWKT